MSKLSTISVAGLVLFVAGVPAWAGAIGGAVTGGTANSNGGTYVQLTVPWGSISTPANTVGNNNFNTWNLYEFDEVQSYTLTAPLVTSTGTIPAGTVIDSQYVFFDPPGSSGGNLIGNVQFSGAVLGVVTTDAGLTASNFLGDSGITYEDPAAVGLEAGDLVTIDSTNPDQIDWNTTASNPGDSVRVITAVASTTVPEPSSLLLIGTALIGLGGSVKRKLFS